MRARYKSVKESETPEQYQRRLERDRLRKSQARQRETPEQRKSRLQGMLPPNKRVRETETPEQRKARLEKCRKISAEKKNGKKNSKDATPAEPAFVIKEEPIEFDPEPSTSAEIVILNANEDTFSCRTRRRQKRNPSSSTQNHLHLQILSSRMSLSFAVKNTLAVLLLYHHPLNPPLT
ncbi:hypothetical protein CEXT_544981 [Caerostris extrusa]|uniref:STPR domain-containing protein n=1 Tax=Caerostris extrusa TaxID=172846 RepID=A0AAV4TGM2_CAEEX|nr:hypothetical protein CEXT_544981 [Caerostris extrusa]